MIVVRYADDLVAGFEHEDDARRVMDEAQDFAPSSGVTISTASTLALASQARKYGLGPHESPHFQMTP